MCLKINNFLCCLSLKTGGLVIGWVTLIINLLSTVFYTAGLTIFLILSCKDFEDLLREIGYEVPDDFDESCGNESYRGIYIAAAVVVIIIFLILTLIGYLCISGTLNRQTCKIKPLMCLLGIGIFFSVFGIIFSLSIQAIISGLITISIDTYLFICLYSLISKIQEENNRGYVFATSA